MAKQNRITEWTLTTIENLLSTDYVRVVKNGVSRLCRIDQLPFVYLIGGKVPASLLPAAIDDVIDLVAITATPPVSANTGELYYNTSTLKIYTWAGSWTNPVTPSQGKIYLPIGSTLTYRWTGTVMGIAGGNIELGITDSTAGRGDWTKEAYDFTKGQVLTNLNQLDAGTNGFWYTTPAVNVKIQGFNVVCVFSYGYNIDNIGLFAICEGAYFTSSKYDGTNDWQKHLTATDILGSIKKADLNTLKTDALPSYVESPSGTYTASANGALTLDGGVTAVAGQTVFVSTLNKCFTITSAGSAGTKWVLTTLLPNSSSTNAIITTENVSSVWIYYNSTYNRSYSSIDAALKVDKVAGKELSENDLTDDRLYMLENSIKGDYVSFATVSPLPPHVFSGDTATSTTNSALNIDGFNPTLNDLILVKDESFDSYNNAIYKVTQEGVDGLTPWKLTRQSIVSRPSKELVTFVGGGIVNESCTFILSGYRYINLSNPIFELGLKAGGTTNYTNFDTNGHQTMNGDATVWDDLNFSPLTAASGVTVPDLVTINNVRYREFTSANNQICGAGEEIRHPYKLNTNLYPHIHIFLKGGESAGTTGVTFTMYWELRQSTGTTNGSVTLSATSAQLTANPHKYTISGTSFAGSAELGGQLSLTLARTAGDAGDVIVTTYGVHYEIDSIGSREITTK